MTRVIVDASLLAKLHNLTETLVLCDEGGACFQPFRPLSRPLAMGARFAGRQ
jgi:hypothetical protein